MHGQDLVRVALIEFSAHIGFESIVHATGVVNAQNFTAFQIWRRLRVIQKPR